MYKIVLTGGGTAGHIMPNLALLPALNKYFDCIHYIGSNNGMEKRLVSKKDIYFHTTDVVKMDRIHKLKNLKIPFVMIKAVKQAKVLLQRIEPNAIFSKGGYVSLPTCFAAWQLKIPIIIHESDMTLGMANKIVAKFASKIITSFEETKDGIFIGNPVREEIFQGKKSRAIENYHLSRDLPFLLIVGGSSGSTAINDAVYDALANLTTRYTIIHLSGTKGDFSITRPNYIQLDYAHDINDLYALANVVVSRGGANSLSELSALGKKTLVIPLPKGNSRGDQVENAISYQKRGHCLMLEQKNLNANTLFDAINTLHSTSSPNTTKGQKGINDRIVQEILDTIKEYKK